MKRGVIEFIAGLVLFLLSSWACELRYPSAANRSGNPRFITQSTDSTLALTGQLNLMEIKRGELLLIPGVGDKLEREIFERRYALSHAARVISMEDALQSVPGIGEKKAPTLAEYLR